MKDELKAVEKVFNDTQAAYEKKIETLQKQIAALKEGSKYTKFLEGSPELVAAAEKEGKTLEEYFFDVMEFVKNSNVAHLPIPEETMERVKRIAEMRCKTVQELMKMPDMKQSLITALDNLVY